MDTVDWIREAELRKVIGLANAQAGADAAHARWCQAAYELLCEYVRTTRLPFLAEDYVRWARDRLESPHDPRAWGVPVQRGAREGLILKCGYAPSNSSNRGIKPLWRSAA
jgi:hypothetical protein